VDAIGSAPATRTPRSGSPPAPGPPPDGVTLLRTRRFDVRAWTDDDLAALHAVLGDPRVVWWDDEAGPLEHSREVLRRVQHATAHGPDGCGWFAVVERTSGEVVGNLMLREPLVEEEGLEIGWHVRVADQGRGVATEVARAAVEHARDRLHAERVVALISTGNLPSERVAAKLHMRPTATFDHLGVPHRLHVLDLRVGHPGG
jgi:RimJ/RimL family protein N-acetyltransferase